LYPNPVKNTFKVNTIIDGLYIYNATGQLVKKFTEHYAKNTEFLVRELNNGFYIVKIISNNTTITKKIFIE
jgi:hypothetical protein